MTPIRFLALGNSYTIGTGVEPHQRWPRQLVTSLRDRGFSLDPARLVARNGWTSADLLRALKDADLKGEYHLLSLQIGVNDQFDGLPHQTYEENFQELLLQGRDLVGQRPERMAVLSIPDWSVTPFAAGRDRSRISAEIDTFNEINRTITKQCGARYLDITPLSRRAAGDSSLVAGDGLHPSGKMYRAWVKELLPLVMEIILPHPQ